MKKIALLFITTFSLMTSAHALEAFSTTEGLPDNAVIEPLWNAEFERPSCPRGYVVAKRFCWSKENHCFEHCGYFCSKVPKPNDPSERH